MSYLLSLNDLSNKKYKFTVSDEYQKKIIDAIPLYGIDANHPLFNPPLIKNDLEDKIKKILLDQKISDKNEKINEKICNFIRQSLTREKQREVKKPIREVKAVKQAAISAATSAKAKAANESEKEKSTNSCIATIDTELKLLQQKKLSEENEAEILAIKTKCEICLKNSQKIKNEGINSILKILKRDIDTLFFNFTTKGKAINVLLKKYNSLLEEAAYLKFIQTEYSDTYDKIQENIGYHDDYIEKIENLITSLTPSQKTLIIDYANLERTLNESGDFKFTENFILFN